MKYSLHSQSGFSLVETLVAITILLIVITGPLSISSSAARSTSFSSEQVIAFFLAQEGAEIAQKARDDRVLNTFTTGSAVGWGQFSDSLISGSGLYKLCYKSTGCGLGLNSDPTGTLKVPIDCSVTSTSCALQYNSIGNRSRYTHDTTGAVVATPYTRTIYFTKINNNEVKIVSKVSWRTGSLRASQEVFVETYLFNVYGN